MGAGFRVCQVRILLFVGGGCTWLEREWLAIAKGTQFGCSGFGGQVLQCGVSSSCSSILGDM